MSTYHYTSLCCLLSVMSDSTEWIVFNASVSDILIYYFIYDIFISPLSQGTQKAIQIPPVISSECYGVGLHKREYL